MGLFGGSDQVDVDPDLEQSILAEDDRMRRLTKKLLAKSQGVMALQNGQFKVAIQTTISKMYRPDDLRKFDPRHYMSIDCADPAMAASISAIISARK
jgi:hypothetical protein